MHGANETGSSEVSDAYEFPRGSGNFNHSLLPASFSPDVKTKPAISCLGTDSGALCSAQQFQGTPE